jgi:hypothetical protein
MEPLFFLIRLPFFLVGLVLCIGFDIIRFPLIVAFHIAWICWICATRMLGFPFRLIGAAWQNNSKVLTSGLNEKFDEVGRSWSSTFSNYFGNLTHLFEWQAHGSK